jgi:hypothetical protein
MKFYNIINLHTVLALDPASNVGAPRQWPSEAHGNIVPLDPRSSGQGTRLLLENGGLDARVSARPGKDKGDNSKKTGWHLGHEWSQNLGWWVFTLPVHILGLGEESRRWGTDESWVGGSDLASRNKSRSGKNVEREDGEDKLGHGKSMYLTRGGGGEKNTQGQQLME